MAVSLSVLTNLLGENCQNEFEMNGGFLAWVLLVLYTFYILAKVCDGHLTGVLEKIVDRLGISEDVAGATFLAMSSSAPELFCSIITSLFIVSNAGVGNIVGSALFNLLCIIGILPIVSSTGPLKIWWYPTLRDSFFYALSIGELYFVINDGKVVWWEATILCSTYLIYVFYFTQNAKIVAYFGLVAPGEEPDEEAGTGPVANDPALATPSKTANPEITFWVDKVSGTPLGVKAIAEPNSRFVIVTALSPSPTDLVPAWNLANPWHSPVGSGDHIVAVNGKCGDAELILQELRKNQGLEITLSRGLNPAYKRSDSNCSIGSTASSRKPRSKAAQAMLRVSESSGSLRNVLELSGSLKGVLPDEACSKESTEDGVIRAQPCPTEPCMWVVDKCMPRYDRIVPAFAIVVFWVAFFTYFMADGAERFGCVMGIPPVVMGMIILAAGTSVPDMIASMSVARDGFADMAAANAVGSNTFNNLLGLGGPWLVGCLMGRDAEIPAAQLSESLYILAGCLVLYILMLQVNQWRLTRAMGIAMISIYVASIGFTLYRAYTVYALEEQ